MLEAPAAVGSTPLRLIDRDPPEPAGGEVRLRVHVCACCRTDLHVVNGELDLPKLPVVPGHQVVGTVDALGDGSTRLRIGERVGVCWLHWADGVCQYCRRGQENLCEHGTFTGWTVDGGYAEAITVPEDFAIHLPDELDDLAASPLLCAGAVGYRALRRAEIEPGERVALMGFGSSAHLVMQLLRYWGCEVYVLTRGEGHRALGTRARCGLGRRRRRAAARDVRPRCGVRARGRARARRVRARYGRVGRCRSPAST